jgi:hypothetical protein
MCHHEGYHTARAWEIEAGDRGSREGGEELSYDLPWSVLALFVVTVTAIGGSVSLLIQLLR